MSTPFRIGDRGWIRLYLKISGLYIARVFDFPLEKPG